MEARVHVSKYGITEKNVLISEHIGAREVTLDMFEPPIFVEHGEGSDDPVILYQSEIVYERIYPGEILPFTQDGRLIEITHRTAPKPLL